MSFQTSAQEHINKIQEKYRSKEFRYKHAFSKYRYYEGLKKVFTDEETTNDLHEGMRILATYCKTNEQ